MPITRHMNLTNGVLTLTRVEGGPAVAVVFDCGSSLPLVSGGFVRFRVRAGHGYPLPLTESTHVAVVTQTWTHQGETGSVRCEDVRFEPKDFTLIEAEDGIEIEFVGLVRGKVILDV
jgi:hypothetical protein